MVHSLFYRHVKGSGAGQSPKSRHRFGLCRPVRNPSSSHPLVLHSVASLYFALPFPGGERLCGNGGPPRRGTGRCEAVGGGSAQHCSASTKPSFSWPAASTSAYVAWRPWVRNFMAGQRCGRRCGQRETHKRSRQEPLGTGGSAQNNAGFVAAQVFVNEGKMALRREERATVALSWPSGRVEMGRGWKRKWEGKAHFCPKTRGLGMPRAGSVTTRPLHASPPPAAQGQQHCPASARCCEEKSTKCCQGLGYELLTADGGCRTPPILPRIKFFHLEPSRHRSRGR